MNRFLEYKEKNPELFRWVKAFRAYRQVCGCPAGSYAEMWFESMNDLEEAMARLPKGEGMKKLIQEFHSVIESATFSVATWSPVV